jgi:diguanylate cyclase (GGDEF)-like protein
MKLTTVATAAGVAYALGRLTSQYEVAAARREANTDALTGLTNRGGLMRHLHKRTRRAHPYTVFMLDLNGFKLVNDTHGHRAGDQLLVLLSERLRIRAGEHLVARLGGDEFVVACDGSRPIEAELAFAEHIVASIKAPIVLPGIPGRVILGAACGVARSLPGESPRATLHAADQAMYRSKKLGVPRLQTVRTVDMVDESPLVRVRDTRSVRVA